VTCPYDRTTSYLVLLLRALAPVFDPSVARVSFPGREGLIGNGRNRVGGGGRRSFTPDCTQEETINVVKGGPNESLLACGAWRV
jgi:hypothetical protein